MSHKTSIELLQHPLAPYLALWRTIGVGCVHFHRILKLFPDVSMLFKSNLSHLLSLGVPEKIAQALKLADWLGVERDIAWADQSNQHILLWKDKKYPHLLREIADPPPILFIKGDINILNTPQIAIVGSRKPTPSGIESAKIFAKHLSLAGLTITSGLALGIDASSHRAALENDGKTIAILGTGIDRIYPSSHKKLADDIAANGALVSDFPLGTPAKAENFPRRNRIVSGLSLGALVVEAALKSGSLITARLANEQGREVFAIPGSIHNPQSKGCHVLIQQGAKLTQDPKDILEELVAFKPKTYRLPQPSTSSARNSLDADHLALLECVGFEMTSIDDIIERTGFSANIVSSIVLQLELKQLIFAMPGGYFKI